MNCVYVSNGKKITSRFELSLRKASEISQQIEQKWVGLKPKEIQDKLVERDYEVSFYIIHQLLSNAGLSKRSYLKSLSSPKIVPNRNAQFEKISELKAIPFPH